MSKQILQYMALIVGLAVALYFLGSYVMEKKTQCEARGGAMVRGVFGFACVKGAE